MATAGLSTANPYSGMFGQGAVSPASVDPFAQGLQDIQQAEQQALGQLPSPAPARSTNPVLYSPTKKEFFVNGLSFVEDDDTKILQASELLDKPSVGRPQGGDWVEISPDTFGQYIQDIRNPSLGTLFAKNFGIGVDQLQQLAGSALQLAGFEETGGRIVAQQEEDLAKTSVYQRNFTDIESGGDVVDWFVANLGQQGPMLLESIAAAGLGAAVGTATGGPGLGTAGGTIAGFFGKNALKKKIQEAAKNYTAAKAKGAKPSRADVKTLKDAAGYAGAAGGAFLSNYALGTGDIYGEMREQGVDPDDTAARMQALMGAFPYAAADTLGEYVLASRLFGVIRPRAMPEGATRLQRGAEYGRRGLAGGAVGAGVEGTTELGQEALVMGLSGQDLTSDEAVKRFINSFAAGAAVGGAIGGAANLRRGGAEETNLLDSSGTVTGTPLQTRGVQPRTVAGQPMAERGFVGDVTPGEFGPQGVIDLGGMTVGEARLRSRDSYGAPLQLEGPMQAAPAAVPAGQGALQFAPEAPSGIGFTDQPPIPNTLIAQQLQAAQQRQQVLEAEQQRAAQQAAEREQQMDLMQQQAAVERDRQVYEAERAQREAEVLGRRSARQAEPQPPAALPTRPVPIRQPQQLPLFTPAQAPVPSRAEGLRRGVGTQPVPLAPIEPEPTGRAPRQLPLITQAGQPSVAALRSAGTTGPVSAPVPEVGGAQISPTGNVVTPATIEAAQRRIALKRAVGRVEYDNGDVYEGQLKNSEPNGEGIYYLANGDVIVGKFKAGEVTSGTYNFSDGSTYVGSFKDGAFDGQGVFTAVDGSVADGMFKDGAFVPPEPPPVAKKPAAKKPAAKKPTVTKGETLKKGKKETAPTAKLDTTQEEIRQAELDATEAANKKKYDARRKQIEAEEKRTGAYLSDVGVDNENASPLQEGQSGYWERMLASQDSAYQMRKEEFKETKPKKADTLKKGKKDAVQEPSATQVSTRQQSKAGAKVGEGVPVTGKAPTKGEALKTETKKRTQKKDDVSSKFRGEALDDLSSGGKEVNRAVSVLVDLAMTGGLNPIGLSETEARAILDKYGVDIVGEKGQTVDASDSVMWTSTDAKKLRQQNMKGVVSTPAFIKYREDGSYRLIREGLVEPTPALPLRLPLRLPLLSNHLHPRLWLNLKRKRLRNAQYEHSLNVCLLCLK
jgi:hypothetical protein